MHLWPCSSSKAVLQKAIKVLKNSGLLGENINTCLYIKKNEKGVIYIDLYVDDIVMVGDAEVIDNIITALKSNGLVLKVMKGLQDYLSCQIKFSEDKKWV